ncbi:MAG: hypothetical protein PVG65_03180 [Candidatus Thorarchaeota archaeon]|jgi:hypothetical protein
METVFKISKFISAIAVLGMFSAIGAFAGGFIGMIVGPVKVFKLLFSEEPKSYSEEKSVDRI